MTDTRDALARRMLDIGSTGRVLSDDDWQFLVESHSKFPSYYPIVTAAYAQADLALSLATLHAAAQQELLPPWIPAMRQAFGAWLTVAFPHEMDSKAIVSLGDAWQAGWEFAAHLPVDAGTTPTPAQREPAGEPVAWGLFDIHSGLLTATDAREEADKWTARYADTSALILEPLYAAPHPPATSDRAAVLEEVLDYAAYICGSAANALEAVINGEAGDYEHLFRNLKPHLWTANAKLRALLATRLPTDTREPT